MNGARSRQWLATLARWGHAWPVLGAFVLVVTCDLWWSATVHRLPSWDQAHHLTQGIDYARAMRAGGFFHQFFSVPAVYSPGYHLLLAVATLVAGPSPALGLYVNIAVLTLLLVATMQIGTRIGSRRVGCLAAVLLALYPGMVVFGREALIEFTLAAVTTASVAALLGCDGFRNRRASVKLGLLFGCGLLVKPSFAFFLWLPVATVGAAALRRKDRRPLANLAIASVCGLALAFPWYWPHWSDVLRLAAVNRNDALRWGHARLPWDAFRVYLDSFGDDLMTGIGAIVAGFGLLAGLRHGLRRLWLVYAWIFGTLLVLVFALAYRDPKYLLPMLPALAILAADALARVRPAWLRVATITVAIGAETVALGPAEFGVELPWLVGTTNQYAGVAGGEPWAIAEIVAAAQRHGRTAAIGVVPDLPWFNGATLTWQARRVGAPLAFFHISDSGRIRDGHVVDVSQLDLLVLKRGDQGELRSTDLAALYSRQVRGDPKTFRLQQTFPLADGSKAELYTVERPGQ
jgi:4-amino-4-deoxy-L-arabinose transferase-like glycosyltransferase